MLSLLWLIVALPLCGFLLLAIFGRKFTKTVAGIIGVGTVGLSALLTILIGISFIAGLSHTKIYVQTLWQWFYVNGFNPSIAFHLDSLSMVFIFVITFVGFFIHLYSAEFMYDEEGEYSQFFAYMNLFVGSMLILVLADNLLLLYLGWEGVGLCSYLLIGFWYKDPANGTAARKAFIVTRVGDTAMAVGLFYLVMNFNTLNLSSILSSAQQQWPSGSVMAFTASILLLGGALGKSAQLPLQTWLPDAMAGPSPVSALIHAATMVTAGVYLIARTNILFILSPPVQTIVAIIGTLTLLLAGFSALTQYDIKRVLAYSTISQIGYMFLALGVGAWSAAIFHFMIHAFFKALLFLGAGAVIISLHHEHNMFKMGGLRKEMPVIFYTFLIGSASLAALPLITAGFYSKDEIIWFSWSSSIGNPWLWIGAIIGAFTTAIYTFRMVFITFFGDTKMKPHKKPGNLILIPLVVLAVLSVIGGFIQTPSSLGGVSIFSSFLNLTLPAVITNHFSEGFEIFFQVITVVLALLGIYIAYILYARRRPAERNKSAAANFLLYGWGFDWIYDRLFVRPIVWLAEIDRHDFIDYFYILIAWITGLGNTILKQTQTGKLRWYAMGLVIGAILTISIVLLS
ncbi:MAG TPA: NADH-quinone oxidoreductase subunit L [Ignavibacteriaceae bacterium]|nr:NADH-quinone oxidoreductase subunit L [Ignavibacteriaceae bacterium]